MSSPRERLEAIIGNAKVTTVKYKVTAGAAVRDYGGILLLHAEKKSLFELLPSEDPLQDALKEHVQETWVSDLLRFSVNATSEALWDRPIKATLITMYEEASERCAATRRKTMDFIRSVSLNDKDKHIANFLLSMFLDVKKPEFDNKTLSEKREFFERLESLRRVYGKRS
jgi:hypothetical protein